MHVTVIQAIHCLKRDEERFLTRASEQFVVIRLHGAHELQFHTCIQTNVT